MLGTAGVLFPEILSNLGTGGPAAQQACATTLLCNCRIARMQNAQCPTAKPGLTPLYASMTTCSTKLLSCMPMAVLELCAGVV